jgi:hypothetical protein
MAVMNGQAIAAKDNLDANAHPFWSHISILDVPSNGTQFKDTLWINPAIWKMEHPQSPATHHARSSYRHGQEQPAPSTIRS